MPNCNLHSFDHESAAVIQARHDAMITRVLTIELCVAKTASRSDCGILEAHLQIRRIDDLLSRLEATRRSANPD
jgi:hypothetical protein